MLAEICAEIRNYFTREEDKYFGVFHIEDGHIVPHFDIRENTDAPYVRIVGSRYNDGVYEVAHADPLTDEGDFRGAVWLMSPPPDFLKLVKEIEEWQEKNGAVDSAAMSPFNSESFGGYSYSKGGSGVRGTSSSPTWQDAYRSRLNLYRRIRLP